MDRNALLFQVGQHDWAAAWSPDRQCPVPPHQPPPDLAALVAECAANGLLTLGAAGTEPASVFVERPVASELRGLLEAANRAADLKAAHRRAAGYWRWRSAAWPQERRADLHDLLEARHHLRQAGQTAEACGLTEEVCSQLHAWGELDREAALISDTLAWLRGRPAQRAALVHELGAIAQVRGDHPGAERRYQQALDLHAATGDLAGVARCHHSLGVLAQAQGEYARAELRYQQSAELTPHPAGLAPHPAALARHTATPAPPTTRTQPQTTPAEPAPRTTRTQPETAPAEPPSPTTPDRYRPRLTDRVVSWPAAGLAGLTVALLALSAVEVTGLIGPTDRARHAPRAATAGSEAIAVARKQAAAWVTRQISHSAIVACDPAMCADLQTRGFPAGDLVILSPGAPGPVGSAVVVATAAVRSQFGGRLTGVYAPLVLAAFGTGRAGIEIRAIAPDGAAAFRDALADDLLARRQAGAELLRNPGISAPGAAGRELSDGAVDSRLLITLAALADLRSATQPPIRIISFGRQAPGASAQAPLRSIDIAGASAMSAISFLRAQQAPYRAASIATFRLPGGQAAVRIGFVGPSPLGLLSNVYPATKDDPPP